MATWRTILELSGMINNDEFVLHGTHEVTYEEAYNIRIPTWDIVKHPRLVVSRQVTPQEISAGLNTKFIGRRESEVDRRFDEQAPPVTRVLDELHKLLREIKTNIQTLQLDPHKAVARVITYHYYDCLSGGMSFTAIAALRHIIERNQIPTSLKLAGGETLQQFLDEVTDVPRFEAMAPYFDLQLSPLALTAS